MSEDKKDYAKVSTSCEQKVENITEDLNSITLTNTSTCGSCGKEGSSDNMNTCNKCKMVKYCNAVCKKVHKKKHKKDCEEHIKHAAELAAKIQRREAEIHDKQLFKQPPMLEGDCPICFLRLPAMQTGKKYKTCCGKVICSGCIHAPLYDDKGNSC